MPEEDADVTEVGADELPADLEGGVVEQVLGSESEPSSEGIQEFQQQAAAQNQQATPETPPAAPPEPAPSKPTENVVEIDGRNVTINQLIDGWRKSQDYTQKTQELSELRKALERAGAKRLAGDANQDNAQAEEQEPASAVQAEAAPLSPDAERELRIELLLLREEVGELHQKYGDFDEEAVFEEIANTGLDTETALARTLLRQQQQQSNRQQAETAATQLTNATRVEGGASSSINVNQAPTEFKSWSEAAQLAARDLQQKGAKLIIHSGEKVRIPAK